MIIPGEKKNEEAETEKKTTPSFKEVRIRNKVETTTTKKFY